MRSGSLDQMARAVAIAAAACAVGCLLIATGLAFAWLTDDAHISNTLSIAPLPDEVQEPYAALYEDASTNACLLLFDRGEDIPPMHESMSLKSSWRGMEDGTQGFAHAGSRPWHESASKIQRIASGASAAVHPISVLDMTGWFQGMSQLATADVSGISPAVHADGDRTASASIAWMFSGCTRLEDIQGIGTWDMRNIASASSAFASCTSLHTIDLAGWDKTSLRDISYLFYRCTSLEHVESGSLEMPACEDVRSLFEGCTSLRQISDLGSIHCPRLRYISGMFSGCSSMEHVDLSHLGMPHLSSCMNLFKGCASLRYIDISGMQANLDGRDAWDVFPASSELEVFITSNKADVRSAPKAAAIVSDDGIIHSPGAWISDDTGIAFSSTDLARHLSETFDGTGPHERLAFHRSSTTYGEMDAYAAIYDKGDGTFSMLMDEGARAPEVRDGMRLAREIRNITESGEEAAALWKPYAISEVRITRPFEPLSCRTWFTQMETIRSIDGLALLDMSVCRDVERMFYGTNADALDVGAWKLRAEVIGAVEMFACCPRLVELDLGAWRIGCGISLARTDALSVLSVPPTMTVANLTSGSPHPSVRFFDGHWYRDGLGSALTSRDAMQLIYDAHGSDREPITIMRERTDRAYAALYAAPSGTTLMFGRGIDVPSSSDGALLQATFRGLEEQGMANILWSSFAPDSCPWTAGAERITRVAATSDAMRTPLRPRDASRWFQGMSSLSIIEAIESGAIDPAPIRDASWMFFGCTMLASLPTDFIASFSSDLTDTMAMFAGCSSLKRIDPLPTSAMERVSCAMRMYERCSSLRSLDLSAWRIPALTSCSSMFYECTALEEVHLPPAFASPARPDALQLAFYRCTSLKDVDARDWDLSGSYTLLQAFNGCQALESILGAEDWSTATITTMNATFRQCPLLVLDCSGWDISSVTDSASFAFGSPGVISPFPTERASAAEETGGASTQPAAAPSPEPAEEEQREADASTPEASCVPNPSLADGTSEGAGHPDDALSHVEPDPRPDAGTADAQRTDAKSSDACARASASTALSCSKDETASASCAAIT